MDGQKHSLDHDGVGSLSAHCGTAHRAILPRRSSALTADLAHAHRERQSEHSTAAHRLHALASELQAEQQARAGLQQVYWY
jgi:hypothetical protein